MATKRKAPAAGASQSTANRTVKAAAAAKATLLAKGPLQTKASIKAKAATKPVSNTAAKPVAKVPAPAPAPAPTSAKPMTASAAALAANLKAKPATRAPKSPGMRAPKAPHGIAPKPAAPSALATMQAVQFLDVPANPNLPDFERLSRNMTKIVDEGGRVLNAFMAPKQQNGVKSSFADDIGDAVRTLGKVAEYWFTDPQRALQANTALSTSFIELWGRTFRRFGGEEVEPLVPYNPRDKRFTDPQWQDNPVFDFLRQAHGLTVSWANGLVTDGENLDDKTRAKASFYMRQIASAISPSNFLATNPELLRTTFESDGENLVRGLHMLADDIAAGNGQLRLRQSDNSAFVLGENMAMTPGKVVWRNELIELIQYTPTTPDVYARPLLIVPPWINKFYILDLNAEKSFVRWALDQGVSVFLISWVNPDAKLASKGFDDYMREGIFEALDIVEKITGEPKVNAIGYCVGGTLLAVSLAYMAAKGQDRVASATFFAAQVDFTDPGELMVFADKETLANLDQQMEQDGILEGSKMANAFNMLRPEDLIWSYVVSNYLKGKEPAPFDLLTWNSDATRMTRANHSFYLRECYSQNNLTRGVMEVDGVKLDLSKVKIPIYSLAAKEDHIAPAASVFRGIQFFSGPKRYVMAGSGHIAGVINPPASRKYQYWAGPAAEGDFKTWVGKATETPGSWWPDWIGWLTAQAPQKKPAKAPGGGVLKPLGDAPGNYVRLKS